MSASSSSRSRRVNRRRFLQATAIASAAPMVAGATQRARSRHDAASHARGTGRRAHRVRCRVALPLHPEAGRAGPVSDVVHEPAVPVTRRLDRHGPRQGAGPAPLRATPVRSPCGDPRARRLRRLHPREGVLQHHAGPARARLRPGAEARLGLGAGPGDRRTARSRRLLPVGQGEARRRRRRARGPHRVPTALLRRSQHRHRPGAPRLRGGRDRHVLLGRSAHAARRRCCRLAGTPVDDGARAHRRRSTRERARTSNSSAAPCTRPASRGRA